MLNKPEKLVWWKRVWIDFLILKKKSNFFGAKALQNKIQSGVDIKIVYLEVDVDNADARGNEPVYHNNKIVGVVTSGGLWF